MIKFGDTYGLQLDPHDYVRGWMKKYLPSEDRQLIAPPQSTVTQRGNNLLYYNYPQIPEPAINQLVIPTGATRWSHMMMLVTEDDKDVIYTAAGTGPLILQYRAEKRDEAAYRDSDGNPVEATRKTLKMTMWPLAAIPLTTKIVASNRVESKSLREGAFIIPLVDGRYWWQFRNVDAIEDEEFADPSAMLTYLTGRVDETVTVQSLHADYAVLPDVQDNNFESVAIVLESVASQLGLTVVPDMTSADHASPTAGSKFALLDAAASATIDANHLSGKGALDGSEDIAVPAPMMGDRFETDSGAKLPAKAQVKTADGEFTDVTAGTAGYTEDTVTGASVVLRYSWQAEVPSLLVTRIATDYYARYLQQYDISYIGIQQWQPTSYTDCVVHRQDVKSGLASTITRVRSIPFNLVPEEPSAAAAGGGHIMHYRIDDCDADNYYVTATYWTGGCGDPPGKDEYTGLWTVEKLPCDSPWTVDHIDAGSVHGVAAYTYPQTGECTQLWKEITSCGPMTC
tara:strand:+ start:8288 stop:9823 length:1536 start_codon:yes stop_codon:yes gene_type:complete